LPPNYKGHDCEAIARALKKLLPPKTQFESASDYEKRVADAKGAPLVGAVRLGDTVAFPLDPDLLELRYDAERKEALLGPTSYFLFVNQLSAIPIEAGEPYLSELIRSAVIEVRETLLSSRDYVGANAFGARVCATERTYRVCAIATRNKNGRELEVFARQSMKMDAAEAQMLKPRLGAVLVGTLTPPLVIKASGARSATISSPSGYTKDGDALVLNVADVWFYDRSTGRVVTRTAAPPEQPVGNDTRPSSVSSWPAPPDFTSPQQ
jgi:hypothetical protein